MPSASRAAAPTRVAARPPAPWRRLAAVLAVLGPGLVAGAAGDDAGGIATYATVGAEYGYGLLWALVLITVALVVVQVQVARLALVTGKGLAELIREQFGVRWTAFAMLVLLVANGAVTVAEFAGIAAASELFGVPRLVSVPAAAIAVWLIVVRGSYDATEKVFIALAAALLTYVGSAFLAAPDWGEVARQTIAPTVAPDPGYLTTLVTLVGTTVTPYMLFYLQSSLSDKGVTLEEQAQQRADVVVGAVLSDLIALFIIVSTAATLHPHGIRVDSAENAARALKPLAGPYAEALFGLGLSGASMLAASVLPLTTAYAICGAFGWERGISRTWAEAPIFNGLYTTLIVAGAAFVLLPGRSLIELILRTQTLNGLLLPIILIFVTRLANDRSVLDRHTNGRLFNVLAYGTTGALVALTVVLLASGVLGGA